MALGTFKITGQPELAAALNRIAAEVNKVGANSLGVSEGPGIRLRREGSMVVIELAQEALDARRSLFPYVVDRGGVFGVSLTDGQSQWLRQRPVGATSQRSHSIERSVVMVHEGDPSTTYTKLSATPAPYKVLAPGTYISWLRVSALRAEVAFLANGTAPTAQDGEMLVALNKFELVASGAAVKIVSVEVYEDSPQAATLDWKLGFAGAMTGATTAYFSAGRVSYADWASATVTGIPFASLREVGIGGASVTVSASHSVYAQINFSKASRTINGITVNYYTPTGGSIISTTSAPVNTETTGHVLLAEFITVKDEAGADVLWLQQRHTGVIAAPALTGIKIDPGSSSSSSGSSTSSASLGSDKSTAIVPAPWLASGYAALFAHEMPDVRFDDVMTLKIKGRISRVPVDPRFMAVCEYDTVEVCSASGDTGPVRCARVVRGELIVECYRFGRRPAKVCVRLTAIRKGFVGMRFPSRSAQQFEANEAFINSAYPRE
jgi:hypothetical protein